jgi:hypothetical protein
MRLNAPAEPIPPTVVIQDFNGVQVEYTDIALSNGTFWGSPPKICKGDALLYLNLEEAGTATRLCLDLLIDHWKKVVFGPCVEGAVFELKQKRRPVRISMLDGYLTIFFGNTGETHFHLCTDVHRGLGKRTVHPVVAHRRQCRRIAFYREFGSEQCSPESWGIRMWNGDDIQMCSFFLPSPFLNDQQKPQEPDWSRLNLWNELRKRYLKETVPQPVPVITVVSHHN